MNTIGNPKISVIIPCYNYGEFLEEAVQSVLQQSFTDFEIIIVNDGSTDSHTMDVLEKIRKEYPEIIVLNQKNGHLANARNNGIRVSKGEFFLPLDADDKLHPQMLEKCYSIIKENKNLGFAYVQPQLFGDIDEIWPSKEYDFDDLLGGNYIVATSLIRKTCWEEIGGYDESMQNGYEDWEFYIRLGIAKWYGQLIQEPLFYYRKHGVSMVDGAIEKHELNFEYIKRKHPQVYLEREKRLIDRQKQQMKLRRVRNLYSRAKAWRPRHMKKSIGKLIQFIKES